MSYSGINTNAKRRRLNKKELAAAILDPKELNPLDASDGSSLTEASSQDTPNQVKMHRSTGFKLGDIAHTQETLVLAIPTK